MALAALWRAARIEEDEVALRLAFEGRRDPDLMRGAKRALRRRARLSGNRKAR